VFFPRLLGNSLFGAPTAALVGGSLLACFALVSLLLSYRDRRLGEYPFWISLLFFFPDTGGYHAGAPLVRVGTGAGLEVHDLSSRWSASTRSGKDGVRKKIEHQKTERRHRIARRFVRDRAAERRLFLPERN
jgi:hypothetical protein